jgi:hypothetical protein
LIREARSCRQRSPHRPPVNCTARFTAGMASQPAHFTGSAVATIIARSRPGWRLRSQDVRAISPDARAARTEAVRIEQTVAWQRSVVLDIRARGGFERRSPIPITIPDAWFWLKLSGQGPMTKTATATLDSPDCLLCYWQKASALPAKAAGGFLMRGVRPGVCAGTLFHPG